MQTRVLAILSSAAALSAVLGAAPAAADPFSFSTGLADGRLGSLSRPGSSGVLEAESADDFVLSRSTRILTGSFTGLLTSSTAPIGSVVAEIYRVFPGDSTNPPSGAVPTRVNSPSDVALLSRDSVSGSLTYATTLLDRSFTVANSVVNGINPVPNQATGGEGSVTGQLVRFDVAFTVPIELPADHYFFVPQVEVAGGQFLWASSARPIAAPGTPFVPDLQSWIRNENLAPDWLRLGTDIIGGTTFNAAFSLDGVTDVPEPWSVALLGAGLLGVAAARRRAP